MFEQLKPVLPPPSKDLVIYSLELVTVFRLRVAGMLEDMHVTYMSVHPSATAAAHCPGFWQSGLHRPAGNGALFAWGICPASEEGGQGWS